MSSPNPAKPGQVLRAFYLFALGQFPRELKFLCFLPSLQSWIGFLYMYTIHLQRFALTICGGAWGVSHEVGLGEAHGVLGVPMGQLRVSKKRYPKQLMGRFLDGDCDASTMI